jgi:hypothetical protein
MARDIVKIDKKMLETIINRYHTNFKYTRHKMQNSIFYSNDITDILSCCLQTCKYSSDISLNTQKIHLIINFTSKNEPGIVCLNLIYDKYADLF